MQKTLAAATAIVTIITGALGLASYVGVESAEKYHLPAGILALLLVLAATHYLYHGTSNKKK